VGGRLWSRDHGISSTVLPAGLVGHRPPVLSPLRTPAASRVDTVPPVACQECGAPDPRTWLDEVPLCDRCLDRRMAELTGRPTLSDPPPPVTLSDAEGKPRTLHYRLLRQASGIEVELEEVSPRGEGFHVGLLGAHDADVEELLDHVRRLAEAEVGRRQLEPNPHRAGWLMAGDELVGRLACSEGSDIGASYDVIVDGRRLTWDDLGRALEPFEGWRLRLVIEDRVEDLRPDAHVIDLAGRRTDSHPGGPVE